MPIRFLLKPFVSVAFAGPLPPPLLPPHERDASSAIQPIQAVARVLGMERSVLPRDSNGEWVMVVVLVLVVVVTVVGKIVMGMS